MVKLQNCCKINWTKKFGIMNFNKYFLGILKLTVYFTTSAYAAIMWLSFDKNMTVLSKSQTDLCSDKYYQPRKMKCTEVLKMTTIKISAVYFNGCYFLWIHFRENALLFNNNDYRRNKMV